MCMAEGFPVAALFVAASEVVGGAVGRTAVVVMLWLSVNRCFKPDLRNMFTLPSSLPLFAYHLTSLPFSFCSTTSVATTATRTWPTA